MARSLQLIGLTSPEVLRKVGHKICTHFNRGRQVSVRRALDGKTKPATENSSALDLRPAVEARGRGSASFSFGTAFSHALSCLKLRHHAWQRAGGANVNVVTRLELRHIFFRRESP